MRTIFGITLLLLLTSPVQAQWEKYQNLDFSQSAQDSLSGKTHWRAPEFVELTPEYRKSKGKKMNPCLKMSGNYSKDRPGYVYQQYPISVKDYVKIRVSASIKGEGISEGKGSIYCYTKKGEQWLQYKNLEDEAAQGTTDWKQVSLEIWVGPDADVLRIGGSLSGKGSFWLDDFEIQEVVPEDCELDSTSLAFMQECMDLIGQYSLYKNDIDTAQLMARWKRFSSCSESIEGVHQGLSMILRSVDKHSFYWSAEQVTKWQNTSSNENANIPFATGYRIDEHYAYLWMPHFGSGDSITQIQFANHMQQLIDSLDHKSLKGWVLDLRNNGGGNCWPMLAGIGPILGEGVCGYFKEEDALHSWVYQSGGSYEDNSELTQVSIPPYTPFLKNPPVAVLTGPMTGSSGEVVAIAFKNRPRTQLFGLSTAGYSTGNVNHTLSDGSMLFLAQSVYADREKNAYRNGVSPDVEVTVPEESKEDITLDQALQWLKGLER